MTARAAASTFQLPIYPYYCRALSPTLGRWCPLKATDVHALEQVDGFTGQDVYFHKNHMIKYVRLTGVIVAVDEFPGRMVYTLDDSSGVAIEATCAAPPKPALLPLDNAGDAASALPSRMSASNPVAAEAQQLISPDGPNLTNIDVGSVVKIKGGIGIFREQKQIRLKVISVLADTNTEVKCWNDVVKFRREVLSRPWVVSGEEEERCRVEEDREERWKKEEEVRKKKQELRRQTREKYREVEGRRRGEKGDQRIPEAIDYDEKKKKLKKGEGLNPENRVNYPSRVARRRAAGEYDALGF